MDRNSSWFEEGWQWPLATNEFDGIYGILIDILFLGERNVYLGRTFRGSLMPET